MTVTYYLLVRNKFKEWCILCESNDPKAFPEIKGSKVVSAHHNKTRKSVLKEANDG